MTFDEITKDIIVAMIEKGILVSDSTASGVSYPEKQAHAVAAAYEIVFAGVQAASFKQR